MPGQSGNPGGRPRSDIARLIRERAQEGIALLDFWFQVLENKVPGLEGRAGVRDMIQVSELLADRGWGKPTQQLEHAGTEGGALQIVVMTEKATP